MKITFQPVNDQGDFFHTKEVDQDAIDGLLNTKSFSCDKETTGLIPKLGKPRLVQVYLPKLQTCYYLDLWSDLAKSAIGLEFMQVLLSKLADPNVIKVWHNAIFDVHWFYVHFGVMSVNNFDTMIASQILKAGQYFGYQRAFQITPNSLKFLIQEFGFTHDKDVDHEIWKIPGDLPQWAINYAVRDAFYTYIIGKAWRPILLEMCPDVLDAEMGVIPAFVEMNNNGLPCHLPTLDRMCEEYQKKAEEIEKSLLSKIQLTPKGSAIWFQRYYSVKALPKKYEKPEAMSKELHLTTFKPGSSQSVGRWLCDFVPVEVLERKDNKTGKITIRTDKSTLFILSTVYKDRPELQELIYYRSIKGAASKFKSYRESYQSDTQSIAVSYTILARQGTGRSSSGKKKSKDEAIKFHNGQNFSKYLPSHEAYGLDPTRSIIQARPGYVLAEFDSSASHLQYARHLSQDASLIESNELGLKVHFYTLASILRHSDGIVVTPEEARDLLTQENHRDIVRFNHLYKLGKNVIYSFLNYAGAFTLQQQFFKQEVFVSLEDCQLYLDACAEQYSGLRQFQDKTFARVKKTLKAHYVNGKYIGHYVHNTHLDGARTYHQAKIKQSALERFWETIGDANDGDDVLEYDATDEYEYISNLARSNGDLYVKISDVIAACWLRPESTVMKKSVKVIHDLQMTGDYDFRLVNFSHDSYLLEIREEEVEPVASYAFDTQEQIHQKFIPDYKSEDNWQKCIKGKYWEKPKDKKVLVPAK